MKYKFLTILVFIVAVILRFWQLGVNPISLDWDEASLGYNAYSILKTGKDEYGTFLPLSIRSFNDYKPPLYTYLTIFPVLLFGLNEFSTRFTSALFGFIAVFLTFYLSKELFSTKGKYFHLIVIMFFSLSPWHIQFSRVAFEANVALTFFIGGLLFFLKGIKGNGKYLFLSFLMFGVSTYAYHSNRLVAPLFILGLIILYFREIWQRKVWFVLSSLFLFIIVSPLIFMNASSTSARFGSVTILNPSEILGLSIKNVELDNKNDDILGKISHNRRLVFMREVLGNYLDHFNFDFLFLNGDFSARHHAVSMGMLYFWEFPFMFIGLLYLLNGLKQNKFIIWWFIVAPVASALTKASPHAVRSLLFLPIFQIFSALGVYLTFLYISKKYKNGYANLSFISILSLVIFINFYYYINQYYIQSPIENASEWQYGYKEMVQTVSKLEDKYKNIVVTYKYDQPYIYFLFYNKIDPKWYQEQDMGGEIKRQERKFGKYEFRNIDWIKESKNLNVLVIGTSYEIPKDTGGIFKEIFYPDGSVAFRVVER